MNARFNYYVAVLQGKEEKYVTRNERREAYWEEGKEARKFTKTIAEDIAIGLTLNGFPSYIIAVPNGLDIRFTND